MMGAAAVLCVMSSLEAVAGSYVMTDSNIRTAVWDWLYDSAAAEAAYGHISTWETGGVTDMTYLFCSGYDANYRPLCRNAAASFNEDIGTWDTSGVTDMNSMFYKASAFNQDISGWAVHSVTSMYMMFYEASAFDQDLGWCVGDGVDLYYAFWNTPCASTSCGILPEAALKCGGGPMSDIGIRLAVVAWLSDSAAAEATYGHISSWETGAVTDMWLLFCGSSTTSGWYAHCNTAAASFNEDIGAWDTSGVTSMYRMFWRASAFNQDINAWNTSGVTSMRMMFYYASAFDQDISDWAVHSVTDMSVMFAASAFNRDIGGWAVGQVTDMGLMFNGAESFNQDLGGWAVQSVTDMEHMFSRATAFDQDLGWCVNNDVELYEAFDNTPCESTSCGVTQVAGGCAPTPLPTRAPTTTHAPTPAPTATPRTSSSSGGNDGASAVIAGVAAAAALLLAVGAFCFYRRRKASTMDKADEPSSPPKLNPVPTELPPPDEESLETRADAKAEAAETVELTRKLSSFLFGEQEQEPTAHAVAEAEEASTEQLPPPPARRTEPEPAAKAEETYNQIAAWYNEPENAALRATWGAYPDPEEFQAWPGFVAVTNAYLDREAG